MDNIENCEKNLILDEIRAAVARGWCYEKNSGKCMDVDLAEAISQEVYKLVNEMKS